MGRGTRNYDEVWEKLDELRSLREALCDLVGSDDTNVLLRWIEDQKIFSHPCPGKFLLGLTKPKQEVAKKAWKDIVSNLENRKVSEKSLSYILDKLSRFDTIENAIESFEEVYTEIKNTFTDSKEKFFPKRFQ
jgi:hypothetical protein